MKKLYKYSLLLLLSLGCAAMTVESLACTTAVISGKFTKNGRPMIWKIRDTEEYRNHMRRFTSPLGNYVGLINDSDPEGKQIWGGHNDHGFAIMNSASLNVNENDTTSLQDLEGVFMKQALAECRTLADLEVLLDKWPRPRGLAAHFGAIDAEGGAAFYEVNNQTWTRFDADKEPNGYILRTNYSFTGTPEKGYGYVRYNNAKTLFSNITPGTLTVEMVGNHLSRSFYHSQLNVDFAKLYQEGNIPSGFIFTEDFITRYDTSSMILIEGVKKGMPASEMTSWVQIGMPYISPMLPVWAWAEIPEALQIPEAVEEPTISELAMKIKELLYPLRTVEKRRYLYLPIIYNGEGNGLTQQFTQLEREMIPLYYQTTDRQKRLQLQQELIAKSQALMLALIKE